MQLYVRDPVATVTRPVLELKSFVRLELDAGRSREPSRFAFPSGSWASTIARSHTSSSRARSTSSSAPRPTTSSLRGRRRCVAEPAGTPPEKAFDGVVSVD